MRAPSNYPYDESDPFGNTNPPRIRPHTGADWLAPEGSEVYAVADGEIFASGFDKGNGNYIAQTLPDGKTWSYLHLSQIIVPGGNIKEGMLIALSGSTGYNCRGAHLHCSCASDGNDRIFLGIGSLIDPFTYLNETPSTPTKGNDMATGAFYRVRPGDPGAGGIFWQEKPNTALTQLSLPTWLAYAANGNAYADLKKTDIDALIKQYGLVKVPTI